MSLRPILLIFALTLFTYSPAAKTATPKVHIGPAVVQVDLIPASLNQPSLDAVAINRTINEWLIQQAGATIVKPGDADPAATHYLQIGVAAIRSSGDLVVFNIQERLSLLADAHLEANTPAELERVRTASRLVGHRGAATFAEELSKTLVRTLGDLIATPAGSSTVVPILPVLGLGERTGITAFDFRQMKVRKQPQPPFYPALAKEQRIQGVVVVELIVDPSGRAIRAEALEGPPELLMTAIQYALLWEFEPALLNGKPQTARFRLTMPFKLR